MFHINTFAGFFPQQLISLICNFIFFKKSILFFSTILFIACLVLIDSLILLILTLRFVGVFRNAFF